jgi:hypothetical protein
VCIQNRKVQNSLRFVGNCESEIASQFPPLLVLITGKSFTIMRLCSHGSHNLRFFSLPLPVKMLPVTGKFKGFRLDLFTRFYLKLAGKTAESVKGFD